VLGNVYAQARVRRDQCSGGAGVIEMYVSEQDVAEVADLQIEFGKPLLECRECRRGATIYEREAVLQVEQVATDKALFTQKM
jgi:hypothetical protein